jgi:hypothetical protein
LKPGISSRAGVLRIRRALNDGRALPLSMEPLWK